MSAHASGSGVVAIHQPNHLPWVGYFDKLARADTFVLLDDAKFSKGSYGNRVKIKGPSGGSIWLTVPVRASGHPEGRSYREAEIDESRDWRRGYRSLLRKAYGRAPHFAAWFPEVDAIVSTPHPSLADLNAALIGWAVSKLGLTTTLVRSSSLSGPFGCGNARIVALCRRLRARVYLSGRGARAYNEPDTFAAAGIELRYQEFECPRYPQLQGAFEPNLSILDLLLHCGPESRAVLLGPRPADASE